jgi:hypothetical protein
LKSTKHMTPSKSLAFNSSPAEKCECASSLSMPCLAVGGSRPV